MDYDWKLGVPSWLRECFPKKTSFIPQIGDEVVYCPKGHKLYMAEVRKSDEYKLIRAIMNTLPYMSKRNLKVNTYDNIL